MARQSAVKVLQPAVAALAGFYLSMLGTLVLWAVLPLALGWQATVVLSGSMEPTVSVGDIVLAEPVDPSTVKPGLVPLAVNPLNRSELYTHRVVNILPDGRLVTKGDNNGSLDPEPLKPSEIRGLERLRVPLLGAPLVALRAGKPLPMLGFVLVSSAAAAVVLDDRKRSGLERPARGRRRATGASVGPAREHTTRREARAARRRELGAAARMAGGITTALALVASLVLGGSAAAWSGTTKPPTTNIAASSNFVATGVATCGGATYTANANVTVACEIGAKTGTSQNYTLTVTGTGALTAWSLAADWTGYANFVKANFTGNKVVNGSPTAKTGYSITGPVGTGGCSTQTAACNYQYVSSSKAPIVFTFQIVTTI